MRDEYEDQETTTDRQQPQRGSNYKGKLAYIVGRHSKLAGEIKALKFEQKELEDSAWEACGYSAKAIRKLSKESGMDAVAREKLRELEEEIDKGRVALGYLFDTPLGQAAMQEEADRTLDKDKPKRKRGRRATGQQPEAAA